ncbi:membrane-bound lytic murein transglycosylase A [Sulfitobacter delicatus]|uniref:peptidoglycan lytic exotransglycosylase n=2 Tax=Sulfitobacter delicatus TaxID=218672 RepID=A0A1G7IZM4_9RHOB|nr:membrane-bound lytic murein transglycosylase A [Sulfitobacter delicatus]
MAVGFYRRVTGALGALALLAGVGMTPPAAAEVHYQVLDYADLDGWAEDDHAAAFDVFTSTCGDMKDVDWRALCKLAKDGPSPRQFFELFFRPVLMEDGKDPLFTGYFEPELDGDLYPSARFQYPIYAMPPEAEEIRPWLTRREILDGDVMRDRGLEIAWVDDPVELFFLQIQGSGRIRLPDGSYLRVGYRGANGHDYRSVGVELVRRGVYEPHQVSADVIKNWVRRNPEDGRELLYHNPSYVFFREVSRVPADKGPLGAMNRSITAMRSVAVDPAYVPLGAPVWLEKDGKEPLRRLMIAQDTGSAIKGTQRADVFFGTGDKAGRAAGRLRDPGRMLVLMPIQRAYAYLPESAI